ncbi:glyoxylate reductase (NADP(+)) [Gluconacetobacter azotocaptans]|uniref:Glyoxylate reductase (NADP(+)) n=1 Tax=Gluconacetobacter azotocaptans TaxID=142834 RepID=A0A7W4PFJ4_9PROT|nr:NAD(P)-dependent oxidoreductase [Gluconacetobacter azotocaptans]MBB2188986.1 glyoxylate reductase (NADP(+)) [Gluconacetobacter azotocaptans]
MRPLVVVNQLGAGLNPVLAPFGDRVRVLDGDREGDLPWAVGGADILLTGPSRTWKAAPDRPPAEWGAGPRWVQVASAGVDGFPAWLLQGRAVTCGRGDAAVPIAEYVLAALLLREKRLDTVRPDGPEAWLREAAVLKGASPLGGLAGRVVGLAGYGAIGQAVAARARAFGMRVLAWRRGAWTGTEQDVEPVASLADLIEQVDHLVLALPLTRETEGCVNAGLLARAKPGLHLVNVARGQLVDQDALGAALDSGRVGFATLDVTSPEPLPAGHPFYTHPAIRLTPHVSWSGPGVGQNLHRRIAANLERFLEGRPLQDVVDAARGY